MKRFTFILLVLAACQGFTTEDRLSIAEGLVFAAKQAGEIAVLNGKVDREKYDAAVIGIDLIMDLMRAGVKDNDEERIQEQRVALDKALKNLYALWRTAEPPT